MSSSASFHFKARIYKVGINPCVEVPLRISGRLSNKKGYIPVVGEINGFSFRQNLCPVKDAPYRLYVNGIMLKGSGLKNGDMAGFMLSLDPHPLTPSSYRIPPLLRAALKSENLETAFGKLTPYRRKEILRYLSFLKTNESMERNVRKVIRQLKGT